MRIAAVLLITLLVPQPAHAWGFDPHKFIAEQMITLLPAELRPLFEHRKAFVIERSVDPDLWRTVGWETEDPHHFLDLDFYGKYPFEDLPREYDQAVQKFGRSAIHEQGLLPWRTQEIYGRIRRGFEGLTRQPPSTYSQDDIVLFSAILAHYVGDGHVPLHSVVNYDGQLTNQHGLHSRWESELFERNRNSLRISPVATAPVSKPRDFMFDVLLASNRMTAGVLAADRNAAIGREFYDDEYFGAFAKIALPGLEQRVNDSISAVAAMITGAWEQAGRPDVPVELPRTPRRIRRP